MQLSKMFFAAVALVAPVAVNAASITAPPAANGLSFSNISCSISKDMGAASTPNNCAQISASNITVPGTGIQFSSDFQATAGAFVDATIDYTVHSSNAISAVGLYFNGQFEGLGVTSVTESVFNGSSLVGYLVVNCGNAGCTPATEYQNIVLTGSYSDLSVQKDIRVNSNSVQPGNYASASIVDQTFTTTATPEPASLALVGAGLLAAGAIRRKIVKA